MDVNNVENVASVVVLKQHGRTKLSLIFVHAAYRMFLCFTRLTIISLTCFHQPRSQGLSLGNLERPFQITKGKALGRRLMFPCLRR